MNYVTNGSQFSTYCTDTHYTYRLIKDITHVLIYTRNTLQSLQYKKSQSSNGKTDRVMDKPA